MGELLQETSWRDAQLFQKSRVKWVKEGDLNTRFFHNWINARNKRSEIHGLWVGGSWIDSVNEVKGEIFNYFQNHFDAVPSAVPKFDQSSFKRKLGDAENQLLSGTFTEEEIKAAIWSCDSNGSPGPDGFTFGFFKDTWLILKDDIVAMLSEFHRNGKIVSGLNPSFISLIPKKPSPQTIEDYRPISLIGGAYKIISKLLANRLAKVIGTIIGPNQSAFFGG